MDLEDTPIQRLLDQLAPGERREHKRSIDPSGPDPRFWNIEMNGLVQHGSLRWTNKKREVQAKAGVFQYVGVDSVEQPVFHFFDGAGPIGDLYTLGARGAYALGAPVAETLHRMDPRGIEMRKATSQGFDVDRDFYLALISRQLDAIDLSRTNISLRRSEPFANGVSVAHANYPDGFCLRDDIDPDIHCFCDLFTARLLISHEALTACETAGAVGLVGRDPVEGWPEHRLPHRRG